MRRIRHKVKSHIREGKMHAKKELWEGQGNCIKVKHCRKSHFTSTREGEKGEKVNV